MKQNRKEKVFFWASLIIWLSSFRVIPTFLGTNGLWGDFFANHTFLKMLGVFILMAHLTISAMSICFHRVQTHQALKLHPLVEQIMQTWLWMVTSMSKLDWVSVHVYHHTYSDTPNDPHSPVQKGFWRVFFLGVLDYSRAKNWPEVLKIRKRIPANRYEKFISTHLFEGPFLLTLILLVAFGPVYGSILGVLNFAISPLFAVGGVNGLAHYLGYQNYNAKDNSRNLGFLFILNWIICGELDHNNHHKFPKSPTFAHRWFEYDIGWTYIRILKIFGLAKVMATVPKYREQVREGLVMSDAMNVVSEAIEAKNKLRSSV